MNPYFYILRLHLYSRTKFKGFLPKKIAPIAADVNLTENCNARCITCNCWRKKKEDLISTEKAIDIINQIQELGVKRLRFTGGETLLRKDFFDILNGIKNNHFRKITLATNGLLLKKYAYQINKSCLTDLGVSIDGLAETNDMIRGIRGYFSRVMSSLKEIRDKRITIMTTLNHKSVDELPSLFEMCDKNGWLWDFNLLDNRLYFLKDAQLEAIWPRKKDVDNLISLIKRYRKEKFLQRVSDIQLEYARKYLKHEKIEEPPCFMGFIDIFIGSGGEVYSGCYVLSPVGNVLQNKLAEIINSQRYKKRLIKMLNRNCVGCTCGYGFNAMIEKLPQRIIEIIKDVISLNLDRIPKI